MTKNEAMAIIDQSLQMVLNEKIDFNENTDFIEEEILDSVDGMVFTLEVENASGKEFPTEEDLVEVGYFKVDKLVEFLTT